MARIILVVAVVALAAVVAQAAMAQGPAMAPAAMAPPPPPLSTGAGGMPGNLPCVAELAPCANFYQNASVKPAESCCAPLRKAYDGELGCLCSVLTNPALVAAVGIDMKKGISLSSEQFSNVA
uniref:Bifunctional inhibitor/plant lipid transfer protein/seed storage helical domain-containing protein n=1 Tax=Leersia perrieri TaxID=77586 RepID=A0A0D9XID3_9ORYZ